MDNLFNDQTIESSSGQIAMEAREQVESDLRVLSSGSLPAAIKRDIDKMILRLKTEASKLEIVKDDDAFVSLIIDITKDKRLLNESVLILSPVRTLVEMGAIDGPAILKIFEVIDSLLAGASESFSMKVLQICIAAFASPSQAHEPRTAAAKLVFRLSKSTSQITQHVATATLYQIVDVLCDHIVTNNEGKTSPDHWAVVLIFLLMKDIVMLMNGKEPKVFTLSCDLGESILKYILDRHYDNLAKYQPDFQQIVDDISQYIQREGNAKLAMFAPHMISNLLRIDVSKAKKMISQVIDMIDKSPNLLTSIAKIFTNSPEVQFKVIEENMLIKLANQASRFFLSNFKGSISESIVFRNGRFVLPRSAGLEQGDGNKVYSSVVILYAELIGAEGKPSYFLNIFNHFEGVWQRVIQTTEDPVTLESCMTVARMAVRYAVEIGEKDPSQRIFSTICGIAMPNSAAYPLESKEVIALHSMIQLLQELNTQIIHFWPLIFETISRCHHTAAHKRSSADLQALEMIQPSLISFSSNIEDTEFVKLFSALLALSQHETHEFIDRRGTVPNFWLIKSLCYIFVLNMKRTNLVERKFFDHTKYLLQCESSEYRNQMTVSLFEFAREVINSTVSSEECRQAVFDLIFQAANSSYKEVAVIAFSSVLSFLAGGTAHNVKEGWPMILTVLKVVWATPFPENIPNGFRALTFVCNDCLSFLKINDMEVCMSAISTYIGQQEDMNIALGSIGLLWNAGSYIANMSCDNSGIWMVLFKTLQNHFVDKRQNIRESSLQTFFTLVNTFHSQFPAELKTYVVHDVIKPLVDILQGMDSAILAVQGVIQSLRSLNDYKAVITTLICVVETLSQRTDSSSIRAGDATRCYISLFTFDDQDISKEVSSAFLRTIKLYTSMPNQCDLQGAVSVVTEVLPKNAAKMTDEEFKIWLTILNLFCSFQLDKPYLHVATHGALNALTLIPKLSTDRMLLIIEMVLCLIDLSSSVLSAKCFEIIMELYIKSFDDEGRARCMQLVLPRFQKLIAVTECSNCFKEIVKVNLALDVLFKHENSVLRLVELARRNDELRSSITDLMSPRMDLLSEKTFPIFLSLGRGYPRLYLTYFEKFYMKEDPDTLDFVRRTSETVCKAVEHACDILICEERALHSILPAERYEGMIYFMKGLLTEFKTSTNHIQYLMKSIIKLTETRCRELRTLVQQILCQIAIMSDK